ncbi:MAG: hypothetical protein M5R36_26345 [Deltaproteobacteria bacterium]|nr:hypothetical protein [Deltaproteobacteria bacterium]
MSGGELPFMRIGVGTADPLETWADKVQAFNEINDLAWGAQLYWDERDHSNNWDGAHFVSSPRHDPASLTRFRADRSFPAFFNDDIDLETAGRQPVLGNGQLATADEWGTHGGYFDWHPETIVDTSGTWAATVYLVSCSDFDNDLAPTEEAQADLAIRRAQNFHPAPAATLDYYNVDLETGDILQQGQIVVPGDGPVIVSGILLTKNGSRVRVCDGACDDTVDDEVIPCTADDDDDDSADDDTGDDDTAAADDDADDDTDDDFHPPDDDADDDSGPADDDTVPAGADDDDDGAEPCGC